ncbi:MAG: cobalamin-dependent protein, partial [bacterium]
MATYLNKKPGLQAEVVDCVAEKLGYDALLARIEHSMPETVGISSTTFTLIDTLKTARIVKNWRQGVHVCIGGPHVRIYPHETMLHPNVDSVIAGEAEIAFSNLLQKIETGESIEGLPGVLYRGADGIVRGNDQAQYVYDLDTIPFPDRSLINNELYWSVIGETRPSSTLMTSRGCPYRCRYCLHDRRYRCRSVSSVVEEIRHCLSLGIREIFFFDESFAANRAHAKQLCEAIISNGLRFKWHVRIRVNSI